MSVNFDNRVLDGGFSIQLWNNPGKKQKLYLVTDKTSAVEVRLISSAGQKVMEWNLQATNGSNIYDLDFSALARGLYFIEVKLKTTNAKKVIKLLN